MGEGLSLVATTASCKTASGGVGEAEFSRLLIFEASSTLSIVSTGPFSLKALSFLNLVARGSSDTLASGVD